MPDTNAFGEETNVTADAMRAFADMLRKIADQHETIGKALETSGVPSVRVKNLPTGVQGLEKLGKFAGAVSTACHDALSASAVEPIEHGLLLLKQALRRTKEKVNSPHPKAKKAIGMAANRGAGRGAPKPKTQ
jgi:hypothetical protein